MKNWIIALVAVALIATAGSVYADQPGAISQSTLADMGLGGMQTMTDQQGLDVRGKSIAKVSGYIFISAPYMQVYERKLAVGNNAAVGGFAAQVSVSQSYGWFCTKTTSVSLREVGFAFAR